MSNWKDLVQGTKKRIIVSVLTIAMMASFGAYEIVKPAAATAAVPAAAASALSDDSVSALTALDHAMETLAARVTPAVVNVTVTSRSNERATDEQGDQDNPLQQFFGRHMRPESQIEHGLGSGIILSPDGYIVTNNHVIDGAVDIRVTLNDRRVLPAKLIGADPLTDLAVIKVNASNLSSLPWGDSTSLHAGQSVLAFGNPFGMRFTVTRGIVSALNRPNPDPSDRRKPGEFIQTDAAINPGNSGGALVNAHGEVIGINTFLISGSGSFSGMGFAIPAQIAKPVVDTLIRDGKVKHSYMGVGITDVTPENARFFHSTDNTGAIISQVESDSPGAKAGLKVGDVVEKVNGQKVEDAGQLQVVIGQQKPGTRVTLDVMRDGKMQNIPVTLEEMGNRNAQTARSTDEHGKARWGVGIANLTPDLRDQLQLPTDVSGAVITNVEPGSPADNAGLSRGDVIVEVDRKPVKSAAELKQQLGSVPAGQDALVLVWSNGGNTFRVMHSSENNAG
jgi:serine protease Do